MICSGLLDLILAEANDKRSRDDSRQPTATEENVWTKSKAGRD
jgi:hypothetical protein